MKFIQMDAYFIGQAAWTAQAGKRLAELMSEEGEARRVRMTQRAKLIASHRLIPWAEKGFLLLFLTGQVDPSKEEATSALKYTSAFYSSV